MSKSIVLNNISKSFSNGKLNEQILRDVNLNLSGGDIISLLGASGSGKTTLLNILGLLDNANSGEIFIDNLKCNNLNEKVKSNIRRTKIGFIFQFHHLLLDFTVLENIMLPYMLLTKNKKAAIAKSYELLSEISLTGKAKSYPSTLSGGEKQRVAIARALVNSPSIIIADEPTGNLDPEMSDEICTLIINLVKKQKGIAIVATHNMNVAKLIGRSFHLINKSLIEKN